MLIILQKNYFASSIVVIVRVGVSDVIFLITME